MTDSEKNVTITKDVFLVIEIQGWKTRMTQQNSFGRWYQRFLGKLIPEYGAITLAIGFMFNSFVYWGTQQLMGNQYHYDFTASFDRKVPFVKEWIVIYIGCFLFWAVNYVLIAREGKENCYRFATADILSRIICAIFFIVLPTTNIRPEVIGTDVFSVWMRFIYQMDPATNLFPSIHCLVSWFCFIGIRKSKKVSTWYKVFSCVMALLICASTQFTKQHYMIDVVGGLVLAEVCFWIAHHSQLVIVISKLYDSIRRWIFGITVENE